MITHNDVLVPSNAYFEPFEAFIDPTGRKVSRICLNKLVSRISLNKHDCCCGALLLLSKKEHCIDEKTRLVFVWRMQVVSYFFFLGDSDEARGDTDGGHGRCQCAAGQCSSAS